MFMSVVVASLSVVLRILALLSGIAKVVKVVVEMLSESSDPIDDSESYSCLQQMLVSLILISGQNEGLGL